MQLTSLLQASQTMLAEALPIVYFVFLALMFCAGIVRLILLGRATISLRAHVRSLRSVDYRRFQDSEHVIPVSLILPATNEKKSLLEAVENLLNLDFRQYELIVVANSAHTEAWSDLREAYNLLPFRQPFKRTLKSAPMEVVYRSAKDVRLVVLDVRDTSRAGALNAGVNVSSYPIIAPVFADLRLSRDALLKTVYAFVSDPTCVFIGSFARIGTTPEAGEKLPVLAHQQAIERLRLFYTNRAGYKTIGQYLPLSNTFSAFLKSAVFEAGGFSAEAAAETSDLLLRIHARYIKEKRAYCARLLPDAVCVQLPQQKMRCVCAEIRAGQRGMRNTVLRNKAVLRTLRGVRYTRFAEKVWPFIELLGVLLVIISALLGAVPALFAGLYLLLGALLGAIQSVLAVLLEEYAFLRQTDTGALLKRYVLAIFDSVWYRLRTTMARVFS
jgi:cellulose synthase/poly-beta-1,6-N-acetylglucosamine synthase-like glycosyltransferase